MSFILWVFFFFLFRFCFLIWWGFVFLNNKNLLTPKSITTNLRQRLQPVCLLRQITALSTRHTPLLPVALADAGFGRANNQLGHRGVVQRSDLFLFGFTYTDIHTHELHSTHGAFQSHCTGPGDICRNAGKAYRYPQIPVHVKIYTFLFQPEKTSRQKERMCLRKP